MQVARQENFEYTNGPPTYTEREQAFQGLRHKLQSLEGVIEDIGQYMMETNLEEHFLSFVMRLSNVSKELSAEMATVESFHEFMKLHNVSGSSTTGYFSIVPDEVILHIFSYLSQAELCAASLVCSDWSSLTSDNMLWRNLYEHCWGQEAALRVYNNQLRARGIVVRKAPPPPVKPRARRARLPPLPMAPVNATLIAAAARQSADTRDPSVAKTRKNSMAKRLSSFWNSPSNEIRSKDAFKPKKPKSRSKIKDKDKKKTKREGKKHKSRKSRSKSRPKADDEDESMNEGQEEDTTYDEPAGAEAVAPMNEPIEDFESLDDGDSGSDDDDGSMGFRAYGRGSYRRKNRRGYDEEDAGDDGQEDDYVQWKSLFMQYHRTKKNWDTGKYTLDTLTHHKNTVRCVQLDANHNIISASDDKTIQRLDWDPEKGTYVPKMKLLGHEGGIICMQYAESKMMTGSRDKTLRLWDVETEQTISIFKNHTGQVWCLQFDDHKVVSGSDDKRLNVWDVSTGKIVANLNGHSWGVGCLQFDDRKIVSGAADKTLKIWDLATMQCRHTLKGHKSSVRCLQFDTQKIVSGSWDNTIRIWDAQTYKCTDTLEGHNNKLMCLQFDGSKIISGAQDKSLRVWDMNSGTCLATLKSHTDSLCDLYFDDSKLVTGSRDRTVKVWDFS